MAEMEPLEVSTLPDEIPSPAQDRDTTQGVTNDAHAVATMRFDSNDRIFQTHEQGHYYASALSNNQYAALMDTDSDNDVWYNPTRPT